MARVLCKSFYFDEVPSWRFERCVADTTHLLAQPENQKNTAKTKNQPWARNTSARLFAFTESCATYYFLLRSMSFLALKLPIQKCIPLQSSGFRVYTEELVNIYVLYPWTSSLPPSLAVSRTWDKEFPFNFGSFRIGRIFSVAISYGHFW